MTLSTRVSIQWPPELAEEKSSTMVFTSPKDLFVDVRILTDHYPYKKRAVDLPFTDVFQWVIVGTEECIPNSNKIAFHHEVDSMAIAELLQSGKSVSECIGGPDVGNFFSIPDSEDRKETGEMVNPDTGKVQDYIEIWRSLDPDFHTPTKLARETSATVHLASVYDVNTERYQGRIIRLGNWLQGVLYDKHSSAQPLHVVRAHRDSVGSNWHYLIEYGNTGLFPVDGEATETEVEWQCVEANRTKALL